MVTTKQLKELLDEEIEDRKDLESRFKKLLKDYNFFRKDSKNNLEIRKKHIDDYKKELDIKIEKIEKIKSELTSYTLQLITIIVGVFTLIITVTFFGLNREFLNDIYLVNGLFLIFVIIILLWFFFWFIKENPLNLKSFKK